MAASLFSIAQLVTTMLPLQDNTVQDSCSLLPKQQQQRTGPRKALESAARLWSSSYVWRPLSHSSELDGQSNVLTGCHTTVVRTTQQSKRSVHRGSAASECHPCSAALTGWRISVNFPFISKSSEEVQLIVGTVDEIFRGLSRLLGNIKSARMQSLPLLL